jgi:hypothetical protein
VFISRCALCYVASSSKQPIGDHLLTCPVEYVAGDEVVGEYVEALNNLLCSDAKKYQLKKQWSCGVIELLLQMHIAYTSEFSGGAQTAGWLSGKATAHQTKFETNQKNRLDELAEKRKAEEDKRIDAAKNRKAVAEASAQLVQAFQQYAVRKTESSIDLT